MNTAAQRLRALQDIPESEIGMYTDHLDSENTASHLDEREQMGFPERVWQFHHSEHAWPISGDKLTIRGLK